MKHFHFVAAAVAVAFVFAQSAGAQDEVGSKYIGFNIGQANADDYCGNAAACDDEDTGAAFYGGYNLHENFAIELGVASLGDFISSGTIRGTSTFAELQDEFGTIYVGGASKIKANDRVVLFGKAGVHWWSTESKIDTSAVTYTLKDNGINLFYGIGGQVALPPSDKYKLVLEYQVFQVRDAHKGQVLTFDRNTIGIAGIDNDIKQLSLGLTWTF